MNKGHRPELPEYLHPNSISSKITDAYARIKEHLSPTSLVYDETYHIWLKCEHEQQTGSFKYRGALSKLSTLRRGQQIVTASTGNHGLGVARAANIFGLSATIFIPAHASPKKIRKLEDSGVKLITVEGDSLSAELSGKAYAEEHQLPWVSPYNDIEVIAGQGTIGIELDEQLSHIDRVYITVGGGGLLSGIASWMKHHHPEVEIIACQPVNSPEMYLSAAAGRVVTAPDAKDTLSDGSAGPLEEDSITFQVCSHLIDRFILIHEEEIAFAIHYLFHKHGMVVEGAAGVAMAAAIKDNAGQGGTSVVILCGGNIEESVHQVIIHSSPV